MNFSWELYKLNSIDLIQTTRLTATYGDLWWLSLSGG